MRNTRNFIEFIEHELQNDPELANSVDNESLKSEIACLIYQARKEAGLSQKALAQKIGTRQSVVSRLENADYENHSLTTLRKIAFALNKKLHIELRERHYCRKEEDIHFPSILKFTPSQALLADETGDFFKSPESSESNLYDDVTTKFTVRSAS